MILIAPYYENRDTDLEARTSAKSKERTRKITFVVLTTVG